MIVKLHKQARTTPAIRQEIRQATGNLAELAARYNVTIYTIRKWKSRDSVEDRSHTARPAADYVDAGAGAHRCRTAENPQAGAG